MEFRLSLDDFDKGLLAVAPSLLDANPDLFRKCIERFLADRLSSLGGQSKIVIDEKNRTIVVNWIPLESKSVEDITEYAVSLLTAGRIDEAVPFLKLVLSSNPHDVKALYNMGMVLSDKGRLDEALSCLNQAVQAAPSFTNAWVALGIALSRAGKAEAAKDALERAVQLDPQNGYGCRNFAAILMEGGETLRAKEYFEQARKVLPDDPATLFGLAQSLFELKDLAGADNILIRVIDLCPTGQIAEAAGQLRSKITAATFRKPDMPRMDAVMYCLSALQLFSKMPEKQVKEIAFEITLLGRSGLDVNSSKRKYSLKTIPGQFSGLQLVAYMYVAFKKANPELDAGFDLSSEYALACQMHGKMGDSTAPSKT